LSRSVKKCGRQRAEKKNTKPEVELKVDGNQQFRIGQVVGKNEPDVPGKFQENRMWNKLQMKVLNVTRIPGGGSYT